jgi:hypothetical protein
MRSDALTLFTRFKSSMMSVNFAPYFTNHPSHYYALHPVVPRFGFPHLKPLPLQFSVFIGQDGEPP